jgi:hypothetical protein
MYRHLGCLQRVKKMPFEIVGLRELDSHLFSSSYLVTFEEVICVVMIILYHIQAKIRK